MKDTAELIEAHLPCNACGSSDALAEYTDHTFCFACSAHKWKDGVEKMDTERVTKKPKDLLVDGSYQALPKRRIPEDVARKFDYTINKLGGKAVQVATYRNRAGDVVGQKIRTADKKFSTTGDFSEVALYGQHLWPNKGKRVVITEGELDAMSYSVATGGNWPVVSIPTGAQGAEKAIARNLDWLEGYDEIVLLFDNDEPGVASAKKCASIFSPGKCKIAQLPLKDANDMLLEGRVKELLNAVYNAVEERPDGIVNGNELWERVNKPIKVGTPYPFNCLNKVLFGLRGREIVTLTAGSGVGKSTIAAEIAYHLANVVGDAVGYVALEEGLERTAMRFMGIAINKPIHLPGDVTEEERRVGYDKTMGTGRYFMYDHFGTTDSDTLLNKLQYLVKGLGVKWVVLDHLSIMVSGMDLDGDERRQLDYTVSKLRQFTEQTGAGLIMISHLKRVSGDKGHEDGLDVSLSHLRGSQAIAQLSDIVLGVSRDMSSGNNYLKVKCLKNRYAGITGDVGSLEYNPVTGRLVEVEDDFQQPKDDNDDF
jgi:twinkle protein